LPSEDTYNDEEAARRRDEALRRALNTPPPIKPIAKSRTVKPKSVEKLPQAVRDK